MAGFNATDAIFFGFRVVQRDPTMMLALAGLTAVVAWAGMLWAWPDFVTFTAAMQGLSEADAAADPEDVFADLGAAYGAFFGSPRVLGYMLAQILVGLAAQGAILRDLVRDRREGWVMGVQLGADELRLFVVGLVVAVIVLAAYFFGAIAIALVAVILGFIHPVVAGIFGVLAFIAGLLGLDLLGTLLSAAAPASIGERKFVVFGSWRITRSRMWGLLGAYVVLFFIAIVAGVIAFVLTSVLAPQATALTQGMTAVTDVADAGAAFRSPGYILVMLVNSVVNVLLIALWSGVGAYAYRMLGANAGYANAFPPQGGPAAPA
jgi:hypothetical protein